MSTLAERLRPALEQVADEERRVDVAAARAATEPLPGPLKVAFAVQTDIAAGRWNVRRMCDADYEMLCEVKHPFANELRDFMVKAGLDEAMDDGGVKFHPRGPAMWELAWMFTRPSREVEQVVKAGYLGVKDAAKAEFGQCRLIDFKLLLEAVYKQVEIYWSTNLGYEPVPTNGESAKATQDPTQLSGPALTGSDSLTSGAG